MCVLICSWNDASNKVPSEYITTALDLTVMLAIKLLLPLLKQQDSLICNSLLQRQSADIWWNSQVEKVLIISFILQITLDKGITNISTQL